MDSMVVDISGCPGAEPGSDVLIYGRHGGSHVPIDQVATAIGTIPYELLARVGPRVERVLTPAEHDRRQLKPVGPAYKVAGAASGTAA